MPGGQFNRHRIIFQRAKRPIRLNDGPPVLAVILRNRRPTTRAHHDVEVGHRWLRDRKDAITKPALGLEGQRHWIPPFDHFAFDRLVRQPAHAICWTTKHRETCQVSEQRSFETKVSITTHPRTSHTHGQGQGSLVGGKRPRASIARRARRCLDKRRRKQRLFHRRRWPRRCCSFSRLLPRSRFLFATDEQRHAEREGMKELRLTSPGPQRIR